MLSSRFFQAFAVAATALVSTVPAPALAGNFSVAPLVLRLTAAQRDGALEVTNQGTDQAVFQVRIAAWDQDASGDRFAPTDAILLSPPIFTVRPGDTQAIRIVDRRFTMSDQERAFRVYIHQVRGAQTGQLAVTTAFDLPIFVAPIGAAKPELTATLGADAAGKPQIMVHNAGNVHARFTQVSLLSGAESRKPLEETSGILVYVLGGRTRSVPLAISKADAAAPGLALRLHDDADGSTVVLPLRKE